MMIKLLPKTTSLDIIVPKCAVEARHCLNTKHKSAMPRCVSHQCAGRALVMMVKAAVIEEQFWKSKVLPDVAAWWLYGRLGWISLEVIITLLSGRPAYIFLCYILKGRNMCGWLNGFSWKHFSFSLTLDICDVKVVRGMFNDWLSCSAGKIKAEGKWIFEKRVKWKGKYWR